MIIAGCARGVVLLLLVTNSFSRNLDDTSKTLDATVHDPALASVEHRPSGSVGGRLRRWNPAPENLVGHHRAASIGDEQMIDKKGLDGVNVISNVKESKYGYFPQPSYPYGQHQPHYVFPSVTTTAAPIATLPIRICQLLAANAGITAPLAVQTFVQQCVFLIGTVTG